MASPSKNRNGGWRVRMAIPAALRDTCKRLYGARWELIEDLETTSETEARRKGGAANARLTAKLRTAEAALAGVAAPLSDRDVQALAGSFYRAQVAAVGDSPGHPERWAAAIDGLSDQVETVGDDAHAIVPSEEDRAEAVAILAQRGLAADPTTVRRLAVAIFEARWNVAALMARRAKGDWSPDPTTARLPTPSPALARSGIAAPNDRATFTSLLQGFAADKGWGRLDAEPINRALYDRKRTLARLAIFLGHEDAFRVTKADAVAWKEDMQARERHAGTVRNDLSECSAVWKWAIRNEKLPTDAINPFGGISPPKPPKRKRTVRPFTALEARTILQAAREQAGVLRWAPWVCCLTGARLNELCQSVKGDVATIGGIPTIRIHDEGEARSVKNAVSRRTVPLHPALVTEGFLDYVAALPNGSPLFPDVKRDKMFGRHSTEAGRKVSRWLKKALKIDDPALSPNHSWRHHFIDACREVSMPIEVRSAFTGQSAKMDESASYGEGVGSMLELMARHLARVPAPLG